MGVVAKKAIRVFDLGQCCMLGVVQRGGCKSHPGPKPRYLPYRSYFPASLGYDLHPPIHPSNWLFDSKFYILKSWFEPPGLPLFCLVSLSLMSGALKKPIVAKQSTCLSASCGQQSHQSFWIGEFLHAGGCAKRRMQITSWAQAKISSALKLFPSPPRIWLAPSHSSINLTVWFKVLHSSVLVWASWMALLVSCVTYSNV